MMIHADRIFSVTKLEKEDDLVEAMTKHTWPLCYSFHYGDLLYLSDGDSEDVPEYAVVTIDKTEGHHGVNGREVGRIKPGGMDAALVRKIVQDLGKKHYATESPVYIQAEPAWHHSCQLCRLGEDE
ncbi:MAG TPA: hypothetical protein VN455_00760 [Methanotrichaceae archaeon]|nr:hypothetical protein [Methanotrichaceae archaeon]